MMSKRKVIKNNKGILAFGFIFVIASLFFVSCCGEESDTNRPGQAVLGNECTTDADCVHMPVCCHRGAAGCVPASRIDPDFEDRCEEVFCTEECRPCTRCVCEDGFCSSVVVGGCC